MREDRKDIKKEIQMNRQEMKNMAEDIAQMKEGWTKEKEELHSTIKKMEDKMEWRNYNGYRKWGCTERYGGKIVGERTVVEN